MRLKSGKENSQIKDTCRYAHILQDGDFPEIAEKCGRNRCIGKACRCWQAYDKSLQNMVKKAQAGDVEVSEKLIRIFKNFVFQMEKKYFIPGSDREDLIQEAYIGLYHAIKTYQPEAGLSFEEYVSLSIRNSVIRAVRTATQKKQMVLTQAKSIFDKNILNIESCQFQPESATLKSMTFEEIESIINSKLSEKESEIISMKAHGLSAEEIALKCNTEKKTIDNALYRARIKLRKHMVEPAETTKKLDKSTIRAYERLAGMEGKKKI